MVDRGESGTVAHRIFAVEDGEYVTKGDANPVPDTDRVAPENVVGVGRLVVPAIGLPIVWAQQGAVVPLLSWAVFTLIALGAVVVSSVRKARRRRESVGRTASVRSRAGIHRLRALGAAMIVLQFLVDPEQFVVDGISFPSWGVPLVTVALLSLVNLTTARRSDSKGGSGLLSLAIDTIVVVALASTIGNSGIAWILYSLPIIEAAIGFGIAGALFHWLILTSVTLVSRIWVSDLSGVSNSELIAELDQVLDQLSILFLVVIPGAYLAEQLLIDVRSQERATKEAKDRSALLETVVEAGNEVNRMGGQNFEALLAAAVDLGFDTGDVVVLESEGGSSILSSRADRGLSLPTPGEPASGVRVEDLEHRTVIIDEMDSSESELRGLNESGLKAIVATLVRSVESRRVVLRVGTANADAVTTDRLDAMRLLASQAAVALTNDQLVGELRGVRDKMTHQARHDSLTGLANRSALRPALADALTQHERGHWPAVLFLDLNGFKEINDRLGHEAGDELLRQIGTRLKTLVFHPDLIARLGGDEFVVLLHDGTTSNIESTIELVKNELDRPYELTAANVSVGAAIGYAVAAHDIGASELLRRADVAMYEAKRTRTLAMGYDRRLDAPRRRLNTIAADVERAMSDGDLELSYQPIVHAASSRIVGLEALVRWEHPTHGAVPPPVLIDAARDAGIGQAVNRWIVDTAIASAKNWGFGLDSTLFMTVNVSAEELDYPWAAGNVLDAIEQHGVPTTTVWVELSERLVSDPLPVASSNIEALRARGVQLLLDDFGEGQTSLSHLSRLPIGGVKLGREFVLNCMHSDADRIVLEAVTNLSTRLGFFVIAEGIENDEQYDAVTEAGCQLLQGFHLHRPQTTDQIDSLLAAQSRAEAPNVQGVR